MKGENEKILHKCSICSSNFVRKSNLTRHMQIHKNGSRFKCNICSKEFSRKYNLCVHERMHIGVKPFPCSCCLKQFRTKSQLTVHIRIHSGEKPFKCIHCLKQFTTQWQLELHKHGAKKKFKYAICTKEFKMLESFALRNSSMLPKLFKCEQCSQTFSHERYLKVHQRRIHIRTNLKCDICSSEFATLRSLKLHMDVHSGAANRRPHKCNKCSLQFYTLSKLKQHLNIHDKPFKCCVCGKLFARLLALNNHKKKCKNWNFTAMKMTTRTTKTMASKDVLLGRNNDESNDFNANTVDIVNKHMTTTTTRRSRTASNDVFGGQDNDENFGFHTSTVTNKFKIKCEPKRSQQSSNVTATHFDRIKNVVMVDELPPENIVSAEQKLFNELIKLEPELDVIHEHVIKQERIDDNEFDNYVTHGDGLDPEQQNYELVSQLDIIEMKHEILPSIKQEPQD